MSKYRQHVQQLKLMEEKEKLAVQIFHTGLTQVDIPICSFLLQFSRSSSIGNSRENIENSRDGIDYATRH